MKIELSTHFVKELKKYVKNNQRRADEYITALGLFQDNQNHPGLNVEKLQNHDVWTFRVNKGDRVFFVWRNDRVIFTGIGKHDKYRNVGR